MQADDRDDRDEHVRERVPLDHLEARESLRVGGPDVVLLDHLDDFRSFSPDVIIDLILSSENQARQLADVARALTSRVVALSSMDVYRAWGVLLRTEPGPPEPLPLTEDSPLRTVRQLYPPEAMKMMRNLFSWLDDSYDKIGVEQTIMRDPALRGSFQNRLGERMFGVALRRRSEAQEFAFGVAGGGRYADDARPAGGHGAGLIENGRVDAVRVLEKKDYVKSAKAIPDMIAKSNIDKINMTLVLAPAEFKAVYSVKAP